MLLLPVNVTFQYEFSVAKFEPSGKPCWIGQGSGQADAQALQRAARLQAVLDARSPAERERAELIAKCVRAGLGKVEDPPVSSSKPEEGLVGRNPRFELCSGWLTLLPSDGWTQPLPVRWFSDLDTGWPNNGNETRNLKSFSLYVGTALQNVLTVGDKLSFSRNQLGDIRYRVERNGELILSAGSMVNSGGPVALWQESDMAPNPNAGQTIGRLRTAEQIPVIRPYVTVRLNDRIFHLLAGDDAYDDPYYLFLARSNYDHRGFHLMPGHNALARYAAGRLDESLNGLTKQLISDAARELTATKTRIL